MNARAGFFTVVTPIVIMALWVASLAVEVARGRDVILAVSGYDPRDILRGHYITYRVDYGPKVPASPEAASVGAPYCACLESKAEGPAVATWFGKCEERAPDTCDLFIVGRTSWRQFSAGIERFYIPEVYGDKLQRVPSGATIKVRVTRSGKARVTDMYVNGEPILEYAKREK